MNADGFTEVHQPQPFSTLTPARVGAAVAAGVIAGGILLWPSTVPVVLPILGAAAACGVAYLVLVRIDPAHTLSAAIVLSPFAGNWEQVGIPGAVAPDRLLLVGGVLASLIRLRMMAPHERPKIRAVHWLMLAASAYVAFSALSADTLFESAGLLRLVDAFGVLPFLVFAVSPFVFRTAAQRGALLVALLALGVYLLVTAVLETVGATSWVLPSYIGDPSYGIHFGKARGPFAEAVTNGFALFSCSIAGFIAASIWTSPRPRIFALALAIACMGATFLTLQRSVWLATVVSILAVLLVARELRARLLPAVVLAVLVVGAAIIIVPGLGDRAEQRADDDATVWDRKNLNRAAVNMLEDRPLLGFGWGQFRHRSLEYLEQSDSYPLSASATELHNVLLIYVVELGLIGAALWVFACLLGVGGAIASRAPPAWREWRIGLVAIAVFYGVVTMFVPPAVFPNLMLWLFAGIVWAGRRDARDADDPLPA